MATAREINDQIQNLKDQRDQLTSSQVSEAGTYTVNGKTYTYDQLQVESKKLEQEIKRLEKAISPFTKAQAAYQAAQAELARAREIAASPITESPTGISKRQAQADVAAANKKLNQAKAKFDTASNTEYDTAFGAVETIATGQMTEEQKAVLRRRGEIGGGFGATAAPAKPKGRGKTGGRVSGGGGGVPTVPGTSVGDSTTKGGVNYIWNGTKWVAQGKVAFESIVEKFKTMFPSSAWIADIDPAKYPDVRKLLERAVTGRYADSEQGLARFKAEWEATDFFTELRTDNQVREIKSLVGDLGFDTVPFNKFLTTSMNMGWKGDTLKAEVYKEVFRRDDATDAFVNPTAVERVKKSNPYLAVAKIGKQYFSSVDDRDIQGVLTGEMLTEDVQRKQRELAKARYGHLANLIDQGFTLDELATPFKNQAAQLLEKTPDDIDMSQAQFEAAYNYGEPGQKRMMTQGEWEIMLRSDAKYGWDKTNNAKAEARQLASSIAQAFGRVI